ncbi:hypothetical protein [Anaerosacchariphilus polymeriproducens]|uniref:hypothetical protein n=1 Tax=Anaerosacchariphilus polymeriproducens TaxID=1812858 RepID=UPI001F4051CA|nr:hypothetical protein [Anaerosacchariphilus polymeriproducens]
MTRDFTKDSIDTFRKELNEFKDEKDLFGLRYKFPDYDILCKLDIVQYIDNVKKYGSNVTAKCKTADKELDGILKQVETVDANYAARLDAIHGRMEAFHQQIQNITNIMTPEAIDLGENYYGDYLKTFQDVYQAEVKKSEKELKRLQDLSAVYDTKWYEDIASGAYGFFTSLAKDNIDNLFFMGNILNNFFKKGKFSTEGSENAERALDYLERAYLNDKYANKTWYYGGRSLANVSDMLSGAFCFVQGIGNLVVGIGGSSGSMALASTGVGSVVAVPVGAVSGAAVIAGTAVSGFGASLTFSSASNFKDNWEKFKESKSRGEGSQDGRKAEYIKEKRVPLDRETVLNDSEYVKTKMKVKGASVYKRGDKYYYRDTLHKGERAHLEVFDKKGIHLGEADPLTGELIYDTADKSKKLKLK